MINVMKKYLYYIGDALTKVNIKTINQELKVLGPDIESTLQVRKGLPGSRGTTLMGNVKCVPTVCRLWAKALREVCMCYTEKHSQNINKIWGFSIYVY